MSYSAPFPGKEWELAAYYLKTGQIKVDKLIDRKIGMEAIASAFDDLKILGKVKGKILMEGNMSKKFLSC